MDDDLFESTLARVGGLAGSILPKDIASALDISEQAVYKALNNKKIPKTWFYRLSSKYGVTQSWLTTGCELKDDEVKEYCDSSRNPKDRITFLEEQLDKANDALVKSIENVKLIEETYTSYISDLKSQVKQLEAKNIKLTNELIKAKDEALSSYKEALKIIDGIKLKKGGTTISNVSESVPTVPSALTNTPLSKE